MLRFTLQVLYTGLLVVLAHFSIAQCAGTKLEVRNNQECEGTPIHFTVKGLPSNAEKLKWHLGHSSKVYTTTSAKFSHNYNKSGNYEPYVVLLDQNGDELCELEMSQSEKIMVYDKPKADFEIISPTVQCYKGNLFKVRDRSKRGNNNVPIKNYLYGSIGLPDEDGDKDFSFPAAGKYNIHLRISDENGCTDDHSQQVEVVKVFTKTMNRVTCDSFASPFEDEVYTRSGTYTDTVTNANTCDTIIKLNLTLDPVDSSVSKVNGGLKADDDSASYQWLNCLNDYQPVLGATSQTFKPGNGGYFAVEISKTGCKDTSKCYRYTTDGLAGKASAGNIILYPIPAEDQVHLKVIDRNSTITGVKVLTTRGRRVRDIELAMNQSNRSKTIDLHQLKPGIYIMHIFRQNGKRMIKEIVVE